MRVDNLFIIGGEDKSFIHEIIEHSALVFLDKVHGEFDNTFNLIKNFQGQQPLLRSHWLKFQKEVFNKINKNIEKDEEYQYILTNLFFEASPYKTETIFLFFKLHLIVGYIKENNIKNIYLFNVSKDIYLFFRANESCLSVRVVSLSKNKTSFSLKAKVKSHPFASLTYRLSKELKKIVQRLPARKLSSNKCVISYYPGHTVTSEFTSKYYGEVSCLLSKEYAWLFQYVGEDSKLGQENSFLSERMDNFNFIDAYLSLKDLVKIVRNFYKVRSKINPIDIDNIFIFEGVDYLSIFNMDWSKSNANGLLEAIISEVKFNNFFKINSNIKEIIYLLEFQPWESMLNKTAKRYGVLTKGVTHSVVRPNLMNYYHSKHIHTTLYNPSIVGANSESCKKILLDNGFRQDDVMCIEAQRFNYIKTSEKELKVKSLKKSILITTSIDPVETRELLYVFSESRFVFEKIFIKEHPHLPVKSIIETSIKDFPDYELVAGSMTEAFEYADIVFTANSSSVLLESVVEKKITISLLSLSTLPMPAVESAPGLYFVYDSKSLGDLLSQIFSETLDTTACTDHQTVDLFINKDLPLWKRFLEI